MPHGYFISGGWGFTVDAPDGYLDSIYPLPKSRNIDLCVHITYWHNPDRLRYLSKQIDALNELNCNVDIFVHTNIERIALNSRFFTIHHNMTVEYCHFLSWKHRPLMESQLKQYDMFMYLEDDILFTQDNWSYYLKYHDLVRQHSSYIGFVRVETDGSKWYPTDITPNFGPCEPLPRKKLGEHDLWVNTNNFYNGFWLLDNIEMQKYTKHASWNLMKCDFFGGFIREKAAIGPIPFFKEVLLDLDQPGCVVHHMPNNYIGHHVFCRTQLNLIK